MGRIITKNQLDNHKNQALASISCYIDGLSVQDDRQKSRADKLCFWFEDYIRFLSFEDRFSPIKLIKYNRGDIIKIHLGYNVGSEEGGLHYAVVVEDNALSSPVVTIVPLTSIKPSKSQSDLHRGDVWLGDEIYRQIYCKLTTKQQFINKSQIRITSTINEINAGRMQATEAAVASLEADLDDAKKAYNECVKILSAISTMKMGSIALVNQITTISKIRIYDPKHISDVLGGIRLCNDSLDLIDNAIISRFTKQHPKILQEV